MSQTSDPNHPPRTFGTPLSERWQLDLFCFLGCLEYFIFFEKMRNFSDKILCICLGLWTPTHPHIACFGTFLDVCSKNDWMVVFTKQFGTLDPHLPIVWDKVPKKRFFYTFPKTKKHGLWTFEYIPKQSEKHNKQVHLGIKRAKSAVWIFWYCQLFGITRTFTFCLWRVKIVFSKKWWLKSSQRQNPFRIGFKKKERPCHAWKRGAPT